MRCSYGTSPVPHFIRGRAGEKGLQAQYLVCGLSYCPGNHESAGKRLGGSHSSRQSLATQIAGGSGSCGGSHQADLSLGTLPSAQSSSGGQESDDGCWTCDCSHLFPSP